MSRKIFFTSDWHVNHANSIVFDQRPFRDVSHMHEILIQNYNALVPEDGVCYFLGDIGMGSNEGLQAIFNRLNGTKICVLGNHDKGESAMYSAGFAVVLWGAVLYIGGQRVTLSHCPLQSLFREDVTGMRGAQEGEAWHGEMKNRRFSFESEGQFHLHGHIHSGPANAKSTQLGRQMDVGVTAHNYRPVPYSVVESWIARTKDILPDPESLYKHLKF